MTAKKKTKATGLTVGSSAANTAASKIALGGKPYVKPPPRDDITVPREPKFPPLLPSSPVGQFALSTVGGVLRFTATGIAKVTGGPPQVIETEIVGRVAATSMGDATRRMVTLELIVSGRFNGAVVAPGVAALFAAAEAGRLVRLYGPLDRPGCQGLVWSLGEPTFSDSDMNGAGQLTHAMLSVPLSEWTPADDMTVETAPDPAKVVREKQKVKSQINSALRKNPAKVARGFEDLLSGGRGRGF